MRSKLPPRTTVDVLGVMFDVDGRIVHQATIQDYPAIFGGDSNSPPIRLSEAKLKAIRSAQEMQAQGLIGFQSVELTWHDWSKLTYIRKDESDEYRPEVMHEKRNSRKWAREIVRYTWTRSHEVNSEGYCIYLIVSRCSNPIVWYPVLTSGHSW